MSINNCPFCESDDVVIESIIPGVVYPGNQRVVCEHCGTVGPLCEGEDDSTSEWNKPGDRIKALEDALNNLLNDFLF